MTICIFVSGTSLLRPMLGYLRKKIIRDVFNDGSCGSNSSLNRASWSEGAGCALYTEQYRLYSMLASSNSRVFSVLPIILHSSRGSRKGTILVALG